MLGAIGFGVLQGVGIALAATFVYVTLNAMQPRVVLLGRIPGRLGFYKLHRLPQTRPIEGMVICFVQGSLLFFDAEYVRLRLAEITAGLPTGTRWLVIEASAITQVDSTALDMLEEVRRDLLRRGVRLAFTDVQSDVAMLMTRSGLTQSVGAEMFFDDLDDAVIAFDSNPPI
jgi:MFS superfamily sulfate permease-like transporter